MIQTATLIPLPSRCNAVVAGYNHSYAIADHKVYHWGQSLPSQSADSAIENASESKSQPAVNNLTTLPISVGNISTGRHHSFGWNSRQVYCWGSNQNYELGIVSCDLGLEDEKSYGVTRMSLLEKAIEKQYQLSSISCGEHHTLALFHVKHTDSGEQDDNGEQIIEKSEDYQDDSKIQLYAWGESESHQLTLNTNHIVPYPVLTPLAFKHLEKIQSHGDYNTALCNGKVYTWGCNLFSRLGLPTPSSQLPKVRVPRNVSLPEKIIKIALGTYHVVGVSSSGSAYAWGKGNMGQLGIDRFQTESKPVKMHCHQPIMDVSCGQSHTLVLLSDGRLKSCGSNTNGALGHENYDLKDKKKRAKTLEFVQWKKQNQVTLITSGKNHNLVLTKNGEVYGWGGNEYGQVLYSNCQLIIPEKNEIQPSPAKKQLILNHSLQINITLHKSKEKNGVFSQNSSQYSQISELQSWKHRYTVFLLQKQKQQKLLLRQLDKIMEKFHQQNSS